MDDLCFKEIKERQFIQQPMKQVLFTILILTGFFLIGAPHSKREAQVEPLIKTVPVIDGILDDDVWQNARWYCDFVQYTPVENAEPSQKTCFALFFDDNYLYIAVKAYDTSPDSIVSILTRRDQIDGDYVGVMIDSYHDKRTAFTFLVSAAGVKFDAMISDDGSRRDLNWDPIWLVKTNIDHQGWTAEMRIPFAQLRFNPSSNHTWGFQVERRIFRNDEKVFWQPFSRSAPGWVHQMGLLSGLDQINPRKTFDITPYVVSSAEIYEANPGNPYATGRGFRYNGGLDGKIGLTNYLTLDFTINPDFGQVEADPSEVNLTAYESFFSERRPFFVEGRDLMNFQLSFGGGTGGLENLFYSRRIGRQPQYRPSAGEGTFINHADFTPILGALKVTGRTPGGLSVGLLHSVTSSQYALVKSNGTESSILAEPFTNYIAARALQDFNNGNTLLGVMGTAVNRNLSEEHLTFLHKDAYSGGIDLTHYFHNRTYMLRSAGYFSHVSGSKEAIARTQRSPVHYFQRPDAPHLQYDPDLTSLTGSGGNIQFWKMKGNLRFAAALLAKSPRLEINDIGYLRFTDQIFQVNYVGYSFTEPFGIIRSAGINLNQMTNWNFNLENIGNGGDFNFNIRFINNWFFSSGMGYHTSTLSASILRGGPAFLLPPAANGNVVIRTNERNRLSFSSYFYIQEGEENSQKRRNINLGMAYRPSNTLMVELMPSFGKYHNNTQFVRTVSTSGDETRYLMAQLHQQTVAMSLRINYTITPELSLQFWGQPFFASGKYDQFKKLADARAAAYQQRFDILPTDQISFDGRENMYHVKECESHQYSFRNPDFTLLEFLGNMVVRWEYMPGSTLFFVWSQTRDHYHQDGMPGIFTDAGELFSQKAHNVFMIKFTYRFGA